MRNDLFLLLFFSARNSFGIMFLLGRRQSEESLALRGQSTKCYLRTSIPINIMARAKFTSVFLCISFPGP